MALKRQHQMMAAFSMASMTDVIFLLLIFFMVTSTFVFPTALEVNLPESSKQTAVKAGIRVYIDKDGKLYASEGTNDPVAMADDVQLTSFLKDAVSHNPQDFIGVYADESVTYGQLVRVLDLGANNNLKMVLATKPYSAEPQI